VKLTVRLVLLSLELKVIDATPLALVVAVEAEIVPESAVNVTVAPGTTAFFASFRVAARVTVELPLVWIVGVSTDSDSWVAVWVGVVVVSPLLEQEVEV